MIDKGKEALNFQLLTAAAAGSALEAQRALDLGADPNAKSERGDSALALAFSRAPAEPKGDGGMAVAQALLAAGANPRQRGFLGAEPIHAAAASKAPASALRLLMEAGASASAKDRQGCEPLRHAVSSGQEDKVAELIRLGANPLALDNFGFTALRVAQALGEQGQRSLRMIQAAIEAQDIGQEIKTTAPSGRKAGL